MDRDRVLRKRLIRLLVIFSVLLILALAALAVLLWNYRYSEEDYGKMRDQYVRQTEGKIDSAGSPTRDLGTDDKDQSNPQKHPKKNGSFDRIDIDFDGLKKLNPDITGWIWQENGAISYPVLYSGDNEKYLRRMPDQTFAVAGSIFLEARNSDRLTDPHVILYGHNMRNRTMFGELKQYKNEEYFRSHPYFQVYTPAGCRRYRVFAWQVVPADSYAFTVPLTDSGEYDSFVRKLQNNCDYYSAEAAAGGGQILTLSTCTGIDDRFVVHAVCVGEMK